MGLFSSFKKPAPETAAPPAEPGSSQRKDRPTPSRKEAEAARMARLHPELDPKKAKAMNRQAEAVQRQQQMSAVDSLPERALIRDVVDTRFNVGEVAMPVMMLMLVAIFLPQATEILQVAQYIVWGVLMLMLVDIALMWIKFRRLAKERIPDRPTKGLLFYGWNRQMTFRRWRMPAPRVKRGEAI